MIFHREPFHELDQRLLRMLHGGGSAILNRGLAMLVNLATLPLLLRYLGAQRYGIWVTVSTTVVMLAVLDLGIASTLTNHISRAQAARNALAARVYYTTAFWIMAALAVAIAFAFLLVNHFISWNSVLRLHDQRATQDAEWCVITSVSFFLINLPLGLANRALAGYQLVHVGNYFGTTNSVLGLIAIVSGISFRFSLPLLMAFYCGAMLLGTIAMNLWLWLVRDPPLRPHPIRIEKMAGGDLLSQGSLFFLLQITGLVVFNSDNLVIAHYAGATEVTPYSTAWRLFGYASMLNTFLLPSLWSAYADAHHSGDKRWLREKYRDISRLNVVSVSVIAVLLAVGGRSLIRVWAGTPAVPNQLLLWTMALWAILYSVTTNQAALFAATQRLRIQTISAVVAAIANLWLSIYLIQRIGTLGVIIGSIASYAVFILIPQSLEVQRILRPTREVDALL